MNLRKSVLLLSLITASYSQTSLLQATSNQGSNPQPQVATTQVPVERLVISDDGFRVLDSQTHKEVPGYAVEEGIYIVDIKTGEVVKTDDLI